MVKDLSTLLRDSAAGAPPDGDVDVLDVLAGGRRRVRRRRTALVGGTTLAVAAVAIVGSLAAGVGSSQDTGPAAPRLAPVGPVVRLDSARVGVEGTDYRVLTTRTVQDRNGNNGITLAGVTDDGLVVAQNGPRGLANRVTFTLQDPATGTETTLPDAPSYPQQWAVSLGEDRLVFRGDGFYGGTGPDLMVYDRGAGSWSSLTWPGFPRAGLADPMTGIGPMSLGPDDRVYVGLSRNGQRRTYDLWSVSLDDTSDVRDEQTVVGDFDIAGDELTWTDTSNQPNQGLHTRNLTTGEQIDVDPLSGDRCNQLGLQRTPSYVVLNQYCGEHDGVRDDRVQVLTPEGDPVVTLQGDGLNGSTTNDDTLAVEVNTGSNDEGLDGAYVYDLARRELVRVSDGISMWGLGGPTPDGIELWQQALNERRGFTQTVAEWLD